MCTAVNLSTGKTGTNIFPTWFVDALRKQGIKATMSLDYNIMVIFILYFILNVARSQLTMVPMVSCRGYFVNDILLLTISNPKGSTAGRCIKSNP